ncbi:hypothetical protein [Litorilituus lipolyticus]|uniref:Uncharacterized protein n=1 Tax=Litorilituus lipolyticus TaxID=2491017 RepID=A0A502KWV9_9GAMM|nr:hypothetical protein [Litorilituus lipolyticus]TPH14441.1 hypothetical protein EPA86_11625 [Litorilituus lipolyticus]
MQGRSLIAAILIVLGALSSVVVWQYGNFKVADVGRLGFIKQDNQYLVIQYEQQLFWLNPQGIVEKQLDFSTHYFSAKGDFDFFNNGDLLFYHQANATSFIDSIKAYFRITHQAEPAKNIQPTENSAKEFNKNTIIDKSVTHKTGWYRCKMPKFSCQPFAQHLPDFPRAFHLLIKQTDNTVFISSTAEHKLLKLDQHGELQASSSTKSFKFPNQLKLVNNKLWLADTNNHRLVQISQTTNNFAHEEVKFTASVNEKNQFPFLFAVENQSVWVNVANAQMSRGVIQQFDLTGKKLNKLLPKYVQDPMSLVFWQDTIWLADFSALMIEQFDNSGNSLGLFEPKVLQAINTSRNEVIEQGKAIALAGKVAFIVVLLLGIVAAWLLEKRQTIAAFTGGAKGSKQSIEYHIEQSKMAVNAETIERMSQRVKASTPFWLTNRAVKYKATVYIVLAALALLPCLIILQSNNIDGKDTSQLYWFYGVFLAAWFVFVLCFLNLFLKIQRVALGVLGEVIILKNGDQEVSLALKDLRFSNEHLISSTLSIPIGSAKQRYFDQKELNQYVLAQLEESNKLTPMQTFKTLWQQKSPIFIFNVVMVVVMLIIFTIMSLIK